MYSCPIDGCDTVVIGSSTALLNHVRSDHNPLELSLTDDDGLTLAYRITADQKSLKERIQNEMVVQKPGDDDE